MPLEIMREKTQLIKNIILNNILPIDLYLESTELNMTSFGSHFAVVIRHFNKAAEEIPQILESLYPESENDFIISVSDDDILFVKELSDRFPEDVSSEIERTISSELLIPVKMGVGSIVDSIGEVKKSYRQAQIALEIGRVFEREKNIIFYEKLGLGRLIYQISPELCEKFLSEIVSIAVLDEIEKEFYNTIHCFFENGLNISETSRKLFVHRNTLVYRLDKIKKMTGLDIRDFEQAIVFKVAMMVRERIIYG